MKLEGQFCSLTEEEMMKEEGGKSVAKSVTLITVGSVGVANCVLVGALMTPAVGVVALGAGLVCIKKGMKDY